MARIISDGSKDFPIKVSDLAAALDVTAKQIERWRQELDPRATPPAHLTSEIARGVVLRAGRAYPQRPRVIAFLMCKGGVGKTTSAYFIARRLASYGARVLVIDSDSQGNLTAAFDLERQGIEISEATPVLVDVLSGKSTLADAIIEVTPHLHLIPSTPINANLDARIRDQYKNPAAPIKRLIDELPADRYDFVLIDCAPALNLTNTAIVAASETIILPVAPDRFSKMGLDQTLREIGQIEGDFGLKVSKRVVFTKYDAREFTSVKYLAEIADSHRPIMYRSLVRVAADVKNAVSRGEDLFSYSGSNAREDYDALTQEILWQT
ncbi:MAG: ParA family protein [Bdellovibrionota bacterium]